MQLTQKIPMLKQGIKTIHAEFIRHVHYPNFLSPSSDLMQRGRSSLFGINVKK